jgi:hypothetical protein
MVRRPKLEGITDETGPKIPQIARAGRKGEHASSRISTVYFIVAFRNRREAQQIILPRQPELRIVLSSATKGQVPDVNSLSKYLRCLIEC